MPNLFVAHLSELLDEEFDASDAAADAHLCRSLAAGTWGLHPDAWGSYETMRVTAAPERKPYYYTRVDPAWEVEHRRRPVEEQRPKPEVAWQRTTWRHKPQALPREDTVDGYGWLKLTCDDCSVEFAHTLRYPAGGRPAFVVAVRAQGREAGWTCIVGRDRCPKCSSLAAPQLLDLGAQLGDVPEHGP